MSDAAWTMVKEINDFLETMELPPEPMLQQLMAERAPIEAAAPVEGGQAPDFSVELLTADGSRSGQQASLADYSGSYLALLLGSYTCPIYRGQLERFNAMHAQFGEHMEFLMVYVKEAHPEDGWQVGINHDQCVVYDQPLDADGRAAIAADLQRQHGITLPLAIDDMSDTACTLYSGSPERLYLIDPNGVVVHRSEMGPFNMDVVDAWCTALETYTKG